MYCHTSIKIGFRCAHFHGYAKALEYLTRSLKIEEELGDLLFSIVNLSRHLKIDAEEALRKSNKKFVQRFQYLETKIALQGKELKDYSLDEMEEFWKEAKVKSE